MKKQLFIPIAILLFLAIGTTVVALYGKGYRFGLNSGKPELSGTGLLVATSQPDGAQVFIDGHLTTATANTINLFPGEYTVRIFKEGYMPWEKKIRVQKEVVSKAEALLFPTAPTLESITTSGINNPTIDPSHTRIAYTISGQSIRKNGVYVLDMSSRPVLTLQSASYQVADDTQDTFSKAMLRWSPDGQNLVASISASPDVIPTMYLLRANTFNATPQDITATLASVQNTWDKEKTDIDKSQLASVKSTLQKIINQYFKILAWSPDETKILYQASTSGTLPAMITPAMIGTDSTPEDRNIKENGVYVYDIKEDKNFKLNVASPSAQQENMPTNWYPDSKHLIYVNDNKIAVMEYDGGNATTIYAGPFVDHYVFPWPDGLKVVILTNLNNASIAPNLYTIGLK